MISQKSKFYFPIQRYHLISLTSLAKVCPYDKLWGFNHALLQGPNLQSPVWSHSAGWKFSASETSETLMWLYLVWPGKLEPEQVMIFPKAKLRLFPTLCFSQSASLQMSSCASKIYFNILIVTYTLVCDHGFTGNSRAVMAVTRYWRSKSTRHRLSI